MSAPNAGRTVRAFAPGRTEIAGNHTDHQGGRVIAAAIADGVSVTARANGTDEARLSCEGFGDVRLDVSDASPREDERGTTAALVRGMAAGLAARGVSVGGFDAEVVSGLPAGGGLSSSAAFELAVGTALDALFGAGDVAPLEMAHMAQDAERGFFGKPCGLMDQLAVELGGLVEMDFARPDDPLVDPIAFDFEDAGFDVCLVDVHCDHSRYTREYAQVQADMAAVAHLFGKRVLSEVDPGAFMGDLERVRAELGDAATLRAFHYYNEENLVAIRAAALRAHDMRTFLTATRRSGASSAQYLQNVSCFGSADQPAMVALALADGVLGDAGAVRIHGGGFGGSIQAYVPHDMAPRFAQIMDGHLGEGSTRTLRLSAQGAHAEWA